MLNRLHITLPIQLHHAHIGSTHHSHYSLLGVHSIRHLWQAATFHEATCRCPCICYPGTGFITFFVVMSDNQTCFASSSSNTPSARPASLSCPRCICPHFHPRDATSSITTSTISQDRLTSGSAFNIWFSTTFLRSLMPISVSFAAMWADS